MTRDDVCVIVFRHLHELVPGSADRAISLDAPLQEIGVDSLDLVDVASRSMQEMSIKLPRTMIGRIHTLNDLVDVLYGTATMGSEPILLTSPE
jgi:acyl carrier protein